MMMSLVKVLSVLSLLCSSALAADCDVEETSLVQVNQNVKRGVERAPAENKWPTNNGGVVYNRAVADSTPVGLDAGEVNTAFTANMGAIKDKVETNAAKQIDFTNKVHQERTAISKAAVEKVEADRVQVAAALKADREAVVKTAKKRAGVVSSAMKRVNQAKEVAEAHAIKQRQAQSAAMLGRVVGAAEGKDAAAHAAQNLRDTWAAQKLGATVKAATDAMIMKRKMAEAAVDHFTDKHAAEAAFYASKKRKEAEAIKAGAAADAAMTREHIEGAEGINNEFVTHEADREIAELERLTGKTQDTIDAASDAHLSPSLLIEDFD